MEENDVLDVLVDSCLSKENHRPNKLISEIDILPGKTKKSPEQNGSHFLFVQRSIRTDSTSVKKFRKLLPPPSNGPQMLYRARKKMPVFRVPQNPSQIMSRILQAGYDSQTATPVQPKRVPASTPQKPTNLSPKYSLFSSPENTKDTLSSVEYFAHTPSVATNRRFTGEKGLPAETYFSSSPPFSARRSPAHTPSGAKKRRFNGDKGTPVETFFPSSPSPFSARQRPVNVYNRKRYAFGLPKTPWPQPHKLNPFLARKGKLLLSESPETPEKRFPESDEKICSPEIPILKTPQQRQAVSWRLSGRGGGGIFRWASPRHSTPLPDSHRAPFEEIDIELCSSSESEHNGVQSPPDQQWKIKLNRASSLGNTGKENVNLMEEGLRILTESQRKFRLNRPLTPRNITNVSSSETKLPREKAASLRIKGAAGPSREQALCESPVEADCAPPPQLARRSIPFTTQKRKSGNFTDNKRNTSSSRRSNIRIALPLGQRPQSELGSGANERQELSYNPKLSRDVLKVRRSNSHKAASRKKLLQAIASMKLEMGSTGDDTDDEETETDIRWKNLLSDSAHVVDGVRNRFKVTANDGPKTQLKFEWDEGSSTTEE